VKKLIFSFLFLFLILISFLTYLYFKAPLQFILKGDEYQELKWKQEYIEEGYSLSLWNYSLDEYVLVSGEVDSDTVGTYELTYSYKLGNQEGELKRTIVVDDEYPIIECEEGLVLLTHEIDDEEEEIVFPNYSAIDDKDGDISSKIEIGEYDINYLGVQFIEVSATDSSGHKAVYCQPLVIYSEEKDYVDFPDALENGLISALYSSEVIDGQWVMNAYVEEKSSFVLSGTNNYEANVENINTNDDQFLKVSFDLGSIENGEYELLNNNKSVKLLLINPGQYAQRWVVEDKLFTFTNSEAGLFLEVSDFEYLYDIAIDVGHGGIDGGAEAVDGSAERDINLMVSLYEKQRYEEHGLKVWLIREDYEYPELKGEEDWETLFRVAQTLGYYGSVSRVTYSNHHNSASGGYARGPEILVLPNTDIKQAPYVYEILEDFENLYPVINTEWLLGTKDYSTAERINMLDGSTYPDMRVWWAVMRYPYENYNQTVVITYEGCYLDNEDDFYWYVTLGNWQKVSEAKIKAYVEYLGLEYIEP